MFNDRRKKATAYREGAVARKGLSRDHDSYTVSENVKVVRPAGKDFLTHNPTDAKGLDKGAVQARVQNAKMSATPSKSEAKANKRGLKAANSDSQFKVNKPMTRLFGGSMQVGKTVQAERGSKKEASLQKGQAWADSYSKKSSEKFDASIKKRAQKFAADDKAKRKAGK
jgi:hypothetical protein